jgi:hypothetical protein
VHSYFTCFPDFFQYQLKLLAHIDSNFLVLYSIDKIDIEGWTDRPSVINIEVFFSFFYRPTTPGADASGDPVNGGQRRAAARHECSVGTRSTAQYSIEARSFSHWPFQGHQVP